MRWYEKIVVKIMTKRLLKSWNWLDGKKRHIAHIYWLIVVPSLSIIWSDGVPPTIAKVSAIIGVALSSVGLSHATVKKRRQDATGTTRAQ